MLKKYLIALGATSAFAIATPATAATVTYGGTTYSQGSAITIDFSGVNSGALGSLMLTLTGTQPGSVSGDTDYLFNWTLANPISNSTSGLNPFANIGSFGFNVLNGSVDLSTSSATTTSGATSTNEISGVGSGSISGGFSVDFCGTAGPNCAGTANGGPTPGNTFSGNLALELTSAPTNLILGQPIIRFQNTGPNGKGSDVGTPVPAVPEPATWAMMLLGFTGIGMTIRRRRNQNVLAQVA